jgi:Mn2+/Fe2+ NRAMP family transporter
LVAGASDNDPTTVATMVVAGATSSYALSWLTLLLYPLMGAVLAIAAQVGLATRSGLLGTVRRLYGRRWGLLLLVSVLTVNLITLGADLEAGAAAIGLLFGVNPRWFVLPYTALLAGIMLLGGRRGVQRVLRYSIVIFGAYFVTAFLARPDWGAVIRSTLMPALTVRSDYVEAGLAVLGTTLTSYSYVWEVQQEAAEARPSSRMNQARLEAALGMLVAVATFWFILVASGATLGVHHRTPATAQEAAAALQPLAGPLASHLFALGLLSSSLIAVPVLADSSAYLLGEECRWRQGPGLGPRQAPAFHAATLLAILVGAAVALLGLPPIQLLYWASIAGGLGAPVGLVLLLLVAGDRRAMGRGRVGHSLLAVGWTTAVLITAASVLFLSQQVSRLLPPAPW